MGAPKSRGPKVLSDPTPRGGSSSSKTKKKKPATATAGTGGAIKPLLLVGAGMALVPLVRKVKEWLKARRAEGQGEVGGEGSAFSFGKGKGKGKGGKGKGGKATADAGMKRPPGAGPAKGERTGSMPRSGKMASNKKNKARKAEKKAEIQERREREAAEAAKAAKGGKGKNGEVIQKGNNVPKDEDIVGGEAGKTFTTTSHVKVPTWYAKVREERGNQ